MRDALFQEPFNQMHLCGGRAAVGEASMTRRGLFAGSEGPDQFVISHLTSTMLTSAPSLSS